MGKSKTGETSSAHEGTTLPEGDGGHSTPADRLGDLPNASLPEPEEEERELIAFFQDLGKTKSRKIHQLSIIKAFFEDPAKFGVDVKTVPCSTSLKELEMRKQELAYRADLLKAILESTEAELKAIETVIANPESSSDERG